MADDREPRRPARRAATWTVGIALAAVAGCAGDRTRVPELTERPSHPIDPILLRYTGTAEIDGAPAPTSPRRLFATELRAVASDSSTLMLEQRVWFDGLDAPPALDKTIVGGERVWRREGGDGPFLLLAGDAAREAREFAELVWRAPAPLAGGSGDTDIRRERWRAHPRLGDVLETAHYRHVSAEQGRPVAHELSFERFGATTSQRGELALVETTRSAELARELAPPQEFRVVDGAPPRVRLVKVAPGVVAAEEPESDVRSLVVVFERELVVVEAPLSSAAGERIVVALAAEFPSRPIGHVLVSDASPRMSGGLRAFLAAGATIVTTPDLAPSVQVTVTRPFTLEPDRLARHGGSLRIETFSEGRRFADATNELCVLRLGQAPRRDGGPVVFWLPRAHLLFGGDLGFARAADGSLRATAGGAALRDFLRERSLAVGRLLQATPANGDTGPVAFDDWVRCLPPSAH